MREHLIQFGFRQPELFAGTNWFEYHMEDGKIVRTNSESGSTHVSNADDDQNTAVHVFEGATFDMITNLIKAMQL